MSENLRKRNRKGHLDVLLEEEFLDETEQRKVVTSLEEENMMIHKVSMGSVCVLSSVLCILQLYIAVYPHYMLDLMNKDMSEGWFNVSFISLLSASGFGCSAVLCLFSQTIHLNAMKPVILFLNLFASFSMSIFFMNTSPSMYLIKILVSSLNAAVCWLLLHLESEFKSSMKNIQDISNHSYKFEKL